MTSTRHWAAAQGLSRRDLLRTSMLAADGFAAPNILPRRVFGRQVPFNRVTHVRLRKLQLEFINPSSQLFDLRTQLLDLRSLLRV